MSRLVVKDGKINIGCHSLCKISHWIILCVYVCAWTLWKNTCYPSEWFALHEVIKDRINYKHFSSPVLVILSTQYSYHTFCEDTPYLWDYYFQYTDFINFYRWTPLDSFQFCTIEFLLHVLSLDLSTILKLFPLSTLLHFTSFLQSVRS